MKRSIIALLITGIVFLIVLVTYIIVFTTHDSLPVATGKVKTKLAGTLL